MSYARGWSSRRGTATHYLTATEYDGLASGATPRARALCGSPVRIIDRKEMPYKKSDPRWEICTGCEHARRRKRRQR